jgi:tetratricopeptide (TPR) repeat protein
MAFAKATKLFYERSSTLGESDSTIYDLLYNEDYDAAYDEADDVLRRCRSDGNTEKVAAATLTCAHLQLCCNDIEQASESAEKALELANDLGNAKLRAAATNMLAKVTTWSAPAEAIAKAQEATTLAMESGDVYLRVLASHTMATAMILAGAPSQAATIGSEMVSLLKDSGEPLAEGCALLCASEFWTAADDQATALRNARTAASKFEAAGNIAYEALALSLAARVALSSPNTSTEGVTFAEKAMTLFKRSGDAKSPIPLKLLLAEHLLQGNQYVAAEDMAEEALKTCKDLGDATQEAEALQVLATIRLALAVADAEESQEDIDTLSATEAARYALAAFRKLGNRQGEAKAMYKLAQVRYYAEATDTAKMGAEDAQAIFREVGDVSGEADSVLLVAYVQRADGQFDAAKRNANKAMGLYQSIGSSVGLSSCNEFLDKLKESQTDKSREEQQAKKAQGSTTNTGLVKLVNNAEEATHLLSYFAEMNDEEDTELTEFDLSAWGDSMLAVR